MSGKKIFYGDDARQRVLAGAKIVHDTIAGTLGPRGQNVLLGKHGSAPIITKDGINAVKSITIDDIDDETLGYNVGIELVKSASGSMDKVGDGSTTVAILTYHILNEANKLIAAGYNPVELRKGIEKISESLIKRLDKYSEDISDNSEKVAQIATISSGDAEVGKLIANVIKSIGADGTVTVEPGQGFGMEHEITEGYTFNKGYASPFMATNQTTMEASYKNVPVLVTDAKITSAQDIIPLLESMNSEGKHDLVIIAEDISGDALGMLIFNKAKGAFNTVVIKAPSFGDRRQQLLDDIAIITGATFISSERGQLLSKAEISDLGTAKQVIVSADKTTIIDGQGAPEDIQNRSDELDALVKKAGSDYDKEFHEHRRSSLHGKVAIIRVGGTTETEIEEKKFRVDDAVAAAKAAVKGGIVPGGAITLVNVASDYVDTSINETTEDRIVLNAVEQPFRILLQNAGFNPDIWLQQVKEKRGWGVDVRDLGVLVNMKSAGIIDPTDVTRNALQFATSIAATAITTGSMIVDIPEKEELNPQAQLA
jgi:chaperonin GroEL